MAFALPGALCVLCGLAFLWAVRGDGDVAPKGKAASNTAPASRPLVVIAVFAVAIIAGGMTFNVTTIAMPKIIDERMGLEISLALTGSLATGVFVLGALTQLVIGRLLDRFPLSDIFVALAALQPLGLCVAAASTGISLLFGLVLVTAAIYGQVVVNDAMVAQYVAPEFRAKAFSVRYFLGFTASGFAAPLIAVLHAHGGFPIVLGSTALFGAMVFACAATFRALSAHAAASTTAAE
jgi:MFS family permease